MTDKETKTIIENLKVNKLYKRVINEIVEDSKGYNGETLQERVNARLGDIAHGLSSGIVGSMIYYSDTCKFFRKYKKEIQELVKDYQEQTGTSIIDFPWFDKDDIFCDDIANRNNIAWFAYETIAWELSDNLEE